MKTEISEGGRFAQDCVPTGCGKTPTDILASAAKATIQNEAGIAALKRCATQNR